VIKTQGLFSALYTDRGSHHWNREKAGGHVDKTRLTQVHRGLQQVGATLIPACSPEARGRSKRAFRTLHDRLPKDNTVRYQGLSRQIPQDPHRFHYIYAGHEWNPRRS
jgi:hypothetical protein